MNISQNFISNKKDLYGGKGGGVPGAKYLGTVKKGDTSFPTPTNDGDYVKVNPSSELPFTIQGITFNTSLDQAMWDKPNNKWILNPGAIEDPSEIKALCESIGNNLSQNYYTNSQVMSLIASSRAVYQVATLPSNPSRNTIYYVGSTAPYNVKLIDSNGTVVDLGSSSVDLTDYLKYSNITTTINNNSTNLQVPGAKAVYDGFAPRSSTFICGTYQQLFRNVNDAVFNFDTTGDEIRQVGRRQFCVSNVVNPITNGSVFGFCETEILVNNHTGIGPKVYIYQTVKAMTDVTMIFKRKGMLTGPFDCTKIYENRATISWGNWCPYEYPAFEIARNTTNTTSGVICALISGGTLKVELEAIKLASAPGGNSVIIATIPTGLNNALKSWPGGGSYYRGFAFNVNTTIHSGLIQIYKNDGKIYVFGNFTANENIWGSITATLGY